MMCVKAVTIIGDGQRFRTYASELDGCARLSDAACVTNLELGYVNNTGLVCQWKILCMETTWSCIHSFHQPACHVISGHSPQFHFAAHTT